MYGTPYSSRWPEGVTSTMGLVVPLALGLLLGIGCSSGGGGSAETDSGVVDAGAGDAAFEAGADALDAFAEVEDVSDDFEMPPPIIGRPSWTRHAPAVRRLTHREVRNAVQDIFGIQVGDAFDAMPPEVLVDGFAANAAVHAPTPAVLEAYDRAFREVVDMVAVQLGVEAHGCGSFACGDYLDELLRTVFRRPVDDAEREQVQRIFDEWSERAGRDTAFRLVLRYLLLSPEFLYAIEGADREPVDGFWELDSWEIATRLALLIWASVPDPALLELAAGDLLVDPAVIEVQARRMLDDPRAREGVLGFYEQLLDLESIGGVEVADTEELDALRVYERLQPSMRFEAEIFIARHFFSDDPTWAHMLTSPVAYATEILAEEAYQTSIPDGSEAIAWDTEAVEAPETFRDRTVYVLDVDPERRAGILTLPGILHRGSLPDRPSPVRRGVFVQERILCQPPVPPPNNVPGLDEAEASFDIVTNRDRYTAHTASRACAGCHQVIDGVGFPFENYDRIGAWRSTDSGRQVDASGQVLGTDVDGPVLDAVDLAHLLASSRSVHDCHVLQWYRRAHGRSLHEGDLEEVERLQESFWESSGDLHELIVSIATSDGFRRRRAP